MFTGIVEELGQVKALSLRGNSGTLTVKADVYKRQVHTTSRSYEVNQLLGELEKKLVDFGFFRIHKSYLINLSFISELFAGSGNGLSVHMKGYESRELPVGREKLKILKQLLKIS